MAEEYGVLPISRIGDVLTMAVANPFNILMLDDVQIVTGCDIKPVVSSEVAIKKAIGRAYNPEEQEMEGLFTTVDEADISLQKREEDEELDLSALTGAAEGSPVVKWVNLLIYQAIKNGVSDIHIEPFEKRVSVRYRQDGVLYEVTPPPKRMQNAVVSRVKIMSDLDIAEKRKPQDGKFVLRVDGRPIDFRVSILPVVHGEKVVMRVLDPTSLALSLDQLGFEQKCLDDFRKAINAPYGMVLVTGPTGSGKSTTLYSAIKEVMTVQENIVTVEDPVEYQLDGINQVPVNPKRGVTFANALRSILRQDPDIILIGEIRDLETAAIAIQAALTGHLVFSTLHTNDAASTMTRLVDMGVDPFMVSSSVLVASAQRLIRRLCAECKKPYRPPKDSLVSIGFSEEDAEGAVVYEPGGNCSFCVDGYKGRFALLETLPLTDNIKRAIIEGKSSLEIRDEALKEGMMSLRVCGLLNVLRGNTSIAEVLGVTIADFE
jgi:type IV pilus assembly protein PilB